MPGLLALGLDRLVELAPRMRKATEVRQVAHGHHGVVAVIAVGLQRAPEAVEQALGDPGATTRIVVIEENRLSPTGHRVAARDKTWIARSCPVP